MVNVVEFKNRDTIREQAMEWIILLDDRQLDQDEIEAFLDWLDASPGHRPEFIQLAKLWGGMDVMSQLSHLIPLDQQSEVDEAKKWKSKWRPQWVAMAASLVFVSLIGVFMAMPDIEQWDFVYSSSVDAYSTKVGVQNTIRLADNSVINLNTDSSVKVDYREHSRDIYLERGEAHFDVEHDPKRPFIVHVGDGMVRAVGTAFNIHYDEGIVDVLVTEGVVEVTASLGESEIAKPEYVAASGQAQEKAMTRTSIGVGQTVAFKEVIRSVDTVAPKEIERKLAWKNGMLIFEGDYLEHAIKMITRYTDTQILIKDPSIRNVQVGGYFKTGEIDAMLDTFETSFGIKVTRISKNLIFLSKYNDPELY